MGNRSIVYIDGFNLYYGAVKHTRGKKWLDLEKFFRRLRPDDDIQAIKYFTTLIEGPKKANQEAYLLALSTLPSVEIILGKFKPRTVRCEVKACSFAGNRLFRTREEKRTDVNIAAQMLGDVIKNRCDRLVVVSGDSDLVPATSMVKELDPSKVVVVYVPARNAVRGAAVELRSAADKSRTLPNVLIPRCQFAARIPDGKGGWITKPSTW